MNLRGKVLTAFFTFVIVPLFIVGVIMYVLSQNIIKDNFNEQTELTIRAVSQNVSYIFKEMNSYSEYWRFREQLDSIFAQTDNEWRSQPATLPDTMILDNPVPSPGGTSSSEDGVTQFENLLIQRVLKETFLSFTPINQVTIYNLGGDSISAGKDRVMSTEHEELSLLKSLPVFQEMLNLSGMPRWIGPYEYPELNQGNLMYKNMRVMIEPTSMSVKGYLLIRLNMTELDNTFKSFMYNQPAGSRFMIVNKQGLIIQDSSNELAGTSIYSYMHNPLRLDVEYDSQKTSFNNEESMLATYRLDLDREGISDWNLVYVTPWNYLSGKTFIVLKYVALIIAFCLICALIFNLAFVNRYIRFILSFVASMKRVELGDLTVQLPVKEKKEMGILARGFNSLVSRISSLLEEVKIEQAHKNKAELLLLEAQIKPHFLFNTLESINAMAIQNEGKKVSQLVYRLGSMLRMFEHKQEIPISLELDYLRHYMEIQSFRFENLFEYEIDLPPELGNSFILKLTLQPLIENSIQHGFEHLETGGKIRIRVCEHAETIVIWVEDNGLGVPNPVLSRLQYKTAVMKLNNENTEPERIGLGIPNVADRLRIHYGPQYGILICSDPGIGTIIKVTIPKYTVTG